MRDRFATVIIGMDARPSGNTRSEGKVVYVLGAGFSRPAGAPSQSGILEEIFRLADDGSSVTKARQLLCDFLENELRVGAENRARVALEDIYTPIDRCIAEGTSLKSRTALELVELRGRLEFLISRAISTAISRYLEEHPRAGDYIIGLPLILSRRRRAAQIWRQIHKTQAVHAVRPAGSHLAQLGHPARQRPARCLA